MRNGKMGVDIGVQSAILRGRNVSLEAMNRNKPAAFLCPTYTHLSTHSDGGIGSMQKRATVGAAKIASRLPIPPSECVFALRGNR